MADWPPSCSNEAAHTEVRGRFEAARMWRTHEQSRCPECKLWVIWTRLPAGSLVTCWRCEQRNIDPAALGKDDWPFCPGCVAAMTAEREARWAAEDAARRDGAT